MCFSKLKSLKDKRVVILGDVLIDHYRVLRAERVSPEAPVIIYRTVREYSLPGGAANVANNLLSLGIVSDNLSLCTITGTQWPDNLMKGRICTTPTQVRKTTIKERLITDRQQIVRVDNQSINEICPEEVQFLAKAVANCILDADCLVMSDYGHGVMVYDLVRKSIESALQAGIPIVVDSKATDTRTKYRNATILLPNKKELRNFSGMTGGNTRSRSDEVLISSLIKDMDVKAIGMTMGPQGILFAEPGVMPVLYPPLEQNTEDEVADVTGAGDTVTAAIAAGLMVGMTYNKVMEMANVAAGVVVQKKGVATVSQDELRNAYTNRD